MSNVQTLQNGDKFETYQDKAGEWRWRLTARNGNIVGAANEGFSSESAAETNFSRDKSKDKIELYQTESTKEWRWRAIATNGQNTGSACEGYSNKADAVANAVRNGYTQAEEAAQAA